MFFFFIIIIYLFLIQFTTSVSLSSNTENVSHLKKTKKFKMYFQSMCSRALKIKKK